MGPESFWTRFSEDGKFLSFTAISKVLRECRKVEDAALEQKARTEYNGNFGKHFLYQRAGIRRLMTRPSQVANRYRALRDGENDSDIGDNE